MWGTAHKYDAANDLRSQTSVNMYCTTCKYVLYMLICTGQYVLLANSDDSETKTTRCLDKQENKQVKPNNDHDINATDSKSKGQSSSNIKVIKGFFFKRFINMRNNLLPSFLARLDII